MTRWVVALFVLVGCAHPAAPPHPAATFAQHVILVTVAPGLEDEFITDTMALGSLPGVQEIRIGRRVEFTDPKLGWWIDDYDLAVFIRFANEEVTDAYGNDPRREAWAAKWDTKKLPTFRALRAVSGPKVVYPPE